MENYYPHIGGAEILFKSIAEGLVKKGHSVTVITHQLKGTKKAEMLNGVRIDRISVPSFASRYFFTFACIPHLLKISKNADILQTTTYNAAPGTSLVSRFYKIPSVITLLEVIGNNWTKLLETPWIVGKIHKFLEFLIVNLKFSKYISISESTKKDFENNNKKQKSSVIYCGIDYDFWNPNKYDKKEIEKIRKDLSIKNNQFTYLFYGRPGPSKGFEYLLKAVLLIKKAIPNSKLVAILSKDSAYKNRYNDILKYIKANKLENDVIIHDPVKYSELPKYLLASNCVCVPSLTEGFGFTTAESCALGIPVVASNTTSIPEVISGKYVLVKPASAKSIANGIIDVYTKSYKETKIKKFLWEDCINQYEDIYFDLIAKKQK